MTELLPIGSSPSPVRFTVDDYLLLDSAGALSGYAKTELIDGEVLFVNAQHRPHARVKSRLFVRLAGRWQRWIMGVRRSPRVRWRYRRTTRPNPISW